MQFLDTLILKYSKGNKPPPTTWNHLEKQLNIIIVLGFSEQQIFACENLVLLPNYKKDNIDDYIFGVCSKEVGSKWSVVL